MPRKSHNYPLFSLVILFIAALACASDNAGVKVDEQEPSTTRPLPAVETFKVGDVIKVEDHTIVLNSASVLGSILKANFTIENMGTSELNVSSLLSFDARDSDGTNLEIEIFDCGSSLNGTVLGGDKLRGDICWDGMATDSARIYYESSLFGSGAVVWEVHK